MTKIFVVLLLVFAVHATLQSQQEVTISPDNDLNYETGCLTINMGEQVVFNRASDCGPNISISTDEFGQDVIFSSEKETAPFIFSEAGVYTIFCNGFVSSTSFDASRLSAIPAMCITVVDPSLALVGVVPTLEQWGVINLSLALMIMACVSIKSRSFVLDLA